MDGDELERKLQGLRDRYADKLDGKLAALSEVVARAEAGDAPALTEATREAHKLHGTAGSYGFARVSAVLGQVELALQNLEGEREDAADAFERIQGLLAQARKG